MKRCHKLILIGIIATTCSAFAVKFKVVRILPKSIQKEFAYVPEGPVVLEGDTSSTNEFFISKYEVSNYDYREFVSDLKNSNRSEILSEAEIDTAGWTSESAFMNTYEDCYFWHPAYANYPVVNVSLQGATLYCEWLSEKLNSFDTGYSYEVRLPTRKEWVRASRPEYISMLYAWGGPRIQNKKGQVLCNFKRIGEENIHFDSTKNTLSIESSVGFGMNDWGSGFDITCPVQAYCESSIGLFNMNGNVSELTSDGYVCGGSWNSTGYDVRNESVQQYSSSSPYIGFRPVIVVQQN